MKVTETKTKQMENLPEITAEVARDIESMESEEELRKQVDDIEVTCSLDGSVKEVTISFRSRNIRVNVDLYNGTVKGYSHGSHRVPIMDEDCEKNVLKPLAAFYEIQFDGGN
jgi:hypothetical protein